MELAQDLAAGVCIGFGLLTLTEGYHALRQRAARAERPGRYWWIAGMISAVGLGLIVLGLEIGGVS